MKKKNIGKIIVKLDKIVDEIIICDDGSRDLTNKISKKMGAIVVSHEKNLGYGAAIRSIFLKAIEIDADILVTFDADGQHRVEDIQKVIEPIVNNQSDLVIGSRFLSDNGKNVPKYRKVGIKTITSVTNSAMESKVSDSQSGFRGYSKKALREINPSEYGMGVSTEILIKANKKGLKISEVPIIVLYEGETSTHNPASHGISVLLNTMKFISIERPLRFYGIPGIILFGIGLFFMIWTLQVFTESRQILTNLVIIGVGSTLGGIIMLMTSVMLFSLVNIVRERRSD